MFSHVITGVDIFHWQFVSNIHIEQILRMLRMFYIWSIFSTPSCPVISRHIIAEPIAGEGVTAEAGEARGWPILDIIPVS